jgi:hypothetical protein
MKHTPAPWKLSDQSRLSKTGVSIAYEIVGAADNRWVGSLFLGDHTSHEAETAKTAEGDAALICAAPELLEVCRDALAALNTAPRFNVPTRDTDSYAIAARLEKAIAKAGVHPYHDDK